MDGTERAQLFFCRKNRSLKEPIPLNGARPGRNWQYIGLSGIFFLYVLILYHKKQGKTNVSGREFLWGKKRLRR